MRLQVGDRVAYSVQFLKNTGQVAGPAGHMRGTVKELIPVNRDSDIAVVKWDGVGVMKVFDSNLAKVGLNTRFCSC